MSGYRVTWECCGDETYTHAWEPDKCPFCEVAELSSVNSKLHQALEQIAAFNGVDSYGHVAIARQAIREGE